MNKNNFIDSSITGNPKKLDEELKNAKQKTGFENLEGCLSDEWIINGHIWPWKTRQDLYDELIKRGLLKESPEPR